ncbi:GntR family transcriptional regulator [Leekyejoonella antrihumi]|nr:GntR family transcriptional regulator [Leekyejoonella antrihumi]
MEADEFEEVVLAPLLPEELASQPTSELVYRRLRDAVQTGGYAPFTRLTQEQIAEQLSVSRTPVRDALTRLANDGTVMWTPGRGGYVVPDVTPDGVREVHHVRRALECLGVQEAAPNYSPRDIHLLRSLYREEASADPAHADYFAMNCDFHLALIQPANNQLLVRLLDQLWRLPAARTIANRYIDSAERTRRSFAEHARLIDAAEQHDGASLVRLLGEHIDGSYTYAAAAITSQPARASSGSITG